MNETVSLTLAIGGALLTWTGTVVTLTLWLAGKFRHLEALIYREQNKLDAKYMALFKEHNDRLIMLEVKGGGPGPGIIHPTPKNARY